MKLACADLMHLFKAISHSRFVVRIFVENYKKIDIFMMNVSDTSHLDDLFCDFYIHYPPIYEMKSNQSMESLMNSLEILITRSFGKEAEVWIILDKTEENKKIIEEMQKHFNYASVQLI